MEIKIWLVPRSTDKPDGVKFSIVFIKDGARLIGYDNGEGRGYHRHLIDREDRYQFSDIWKLLDDFMSDLKAMRGRDWDEG